MSNDSKIFVTVYAIKEDEGSWNPPIAGVPVAKSANRKPFKIPPGAHSDNDGSLAISALKQRMAAFPSAKLKARKTAAALKCTAAKSGISHPPIPRTAARARAAAAKRRGRGTPKELHIDEADAQQAVSDLAEHDLGLAWCHQPVEDDEGMVDVRARLCITDLERITAMLGEIDTDVLEEITVPLSCMSESFRTTYHDNVKRERRRRRVRAAQKRREAARWATFDPSQIVGDLPTPAWVTDATLKLNEIAEAEGLISGDGIVQENGKFYYTPVIHSSNLGRLLELAKEHLDPPEDNWEQAEAFFEALIRDTAEPVAAEPVAAAVPKAVTVSV